MSGINGCAVPLISWAWTGNPRGGTPVADYMVAFFYPGDQRTHFAYDSACFVPK